MIWTNENGHVRVDHVDDGGGHVQLAPGPYEGHVTLITYDRDGDMITVDARELETAIADVLDQMPTAQQEADNAAE